MNNILRFFGVCLIILYAASIFTVRRSYSTLQQQTLKEFKEKSELSALQLAALMRYNVLSYDFENIYQRVTTNINQLKLAKFSIIPVNQIDESDEVHELSKGIIVPATWAQNREIAYEFDDPVREIKYISQPVFFDEEGKNLAANILFGYSYAEIKNKIRSSNYDFYLTILILTAIMACMFILMFRYQRQIHKDLLEYFVQLTSGQRTEPPESLKDYASIILRAKKMAQDWKSTQRVLQENTTEIALGKLARKVAHDIRSPLGALDVAITLSKELPPDKKQLVLSATNRIKQIANDLLSISNKATALESKADSVHLAEAISQIVIEKNSELIDSPIKLNYNEGSSYGLFSKVNRHELLRILSNLMNNAIEAFDDDHKNPEIKVRCFKKYTQSKSLNIIEISDNGRGITKEIIDQIGKKNISHGKEQGNGVGLYYANALIHQWGGKISIRSGEGKGTSVRVSLPVSQTPNWFVSGFDFSSIDKIVIFDDDLAVMNTWATYLADKIDPSKIVCIQSVEEFSNYCLIHDTQKTLYLVDFDLGPGSSVTGVDLIRKHKINDHSILVSSTSIDDIAKNYQDLKIKYIEKSFVQQVPTL